MGFESESGGLSFEVCCTRGVYEEGVWAQNARAGPEGRFRLTGGGDIAEESDTKIAGRPAGVVG